MSLLRVANIIEDGRIAGPQLRILAVASGLAKRQIDTTVVLPSIDSQAFSVRLEEANIRWVSLPLRRFSRGWKAIIAYITFFLIEIYLLWRLFRKERFSYVHCSGGFWQIKGLLAAKFSGTPVLWHINDTVFPVQLRGIFLFVCRHFIYRLIFAGQSVYKHYVGNSTCPVSFIEIQAPVNTELFDPHIVTANLQVSKVKSIRIVIVANINPLKGIEYFIDMAAKLNSLFANLHFFVVGPIYESQNVYFNKLKSLVGSLGLINITFLGACKDIPGVLKAADIYVCTSISEASPTSIWEAMSMEKAIVSTDVGDASRFIIDGVSGFIVPIGDVEALADAVARFINDPNLRVECGKTARQIAIKELDLSVCVNKHVQAYFS